jgi:hypothetical protein
MSTAHTVAKRRGIRVRTCCMDGTFYVLRIEDGDTRQYRRRSDGATT